MDELGICWVVEESGAFLLDADLEVYSADSPFASSFPIKWRGCGIP